MNRYFFLPLSLFLSSTIWASNADMEALFLLDIRELQNIKVVTATKSEKNIRSVPSTLRVITDTMIQERGYQSLEEALADLPGMQFRDIQGFNSYTFMRGAPSQNNLILMMVDGVVINELNSGGFYGGLHYNLSNIKRIEVMYGPGSALYGTNAVSGVINIITRDPDDEDAQGLFASAAIGSFDTQSLSMRLGHYDKNSSFGYTLSAMYKTTSKTDLGGDDGANNWSDSMDNFEEDLSVEGRIKYKNLQLGMILQDKKASMTTFQKSVGTDYYDRDTLWHITFANIWAKHKLNINDKTELNSMLYYRNTTVQDDTVASVTNGVTDNNQTGYYRPNSLIGIEERLVYRGIEDFELTTGIVYERERLAEDFSKSYSNSYLVEPEAPPKPDMINNTLKSLYLQGHYHINKAFALTAGVRHEESSFYDTVTTPRGSLIYNQDDTTIKLIYAEAFRAPKPWDYTFGNGNTALSPEEMKSYELFFGHVFNKNIKADITYFNNKIKNKLTFDSINNRWINQGELAAQGTEVSLIYLSENIKSFINYTYTDSNDEDGVETEEIAKHTANAGFTYIPNKNYLSHINVNYVGKKNNPAVPTEDVDAYTLVNAKLSYNGFKEWNIDFMVKNIFDEVYYHTSNRPVTKYRQAERSFVIQGSYTF